MKKTSKKVKKQSKEEIIPVGDIIFHVSSKKEKNIEMFRLSKGYFYFKGEKITDTKKVYEKFSKWLNTINIRGVLWL